jgi:DNA-binding FadR family transcriptional regulator
MIKNYLSDFLKYLAARDSTAPDRLPSLLELSRELGVSVASLREQLEVARMMGLVEVRPKTGIRLQPYSFSPSVVQSVSFAIAKDPDLFTSFSDLRRHLEAAYWKEAVGYLTSDDLVVLQDLVRSAKMKLQLSPPQIPHSEHRELHLLIYKRLNNPFVNGILEAFWTIYEESGMNVYADINYLDKVWQFHERMVEALVAGNLSEGYQALLEHMDLIYLRPKSKTQHSFE